MKAKFIIIIILFIAFLTVLTIIIANFLRESQQVPPIRTFEDCAARGYPIMESFPEQCRTPQGVTFVKQYPNQQVEVEGEIICLPYKDKDGIHTLECAFGLKDNNGNNYALSDPSLKFVIGLQTGKKYKVSGVLKSSQNDPANKYDIVGIIEMSAIAPL